MLINTFICRLCICVATVSFVQGTRRQFDACNIHNYFHPAGLTPEQTAWLDSVRYANVSGKWPELTTDQSMELYTKVFILSKITREDNFPYYETGKGPRASSDTKIQQ